MKQTKLLLLMLLLLVAFSVPAFADSDYLPEPVIEETPAIDAPEEELIWEEEMYIQNDLSGPEGIESSDGLSMIEGIETDSLITVTSNITLTEDTTYDSLDLTTGVLNLNGYTLTVNGDLNQSGGDLVINGGTLNILGNYNIQKTDGTTTGTAKITMTNPLDRINVTGNLIGNTNYAILYNYLIAGEIHVSGDVIQKSSKFTFSGSSVLVLDGKDNPLLDLTGSIGNLRVANTNNNVLVTNLLYAKTITSNTSNLNINTQSGEIALDGRASVVISVPNVVFNGNVRIPNAGVYSNKIYLTGTNTVITGNVLMEHGFLYLNNTTLNINGNLKVEKLTGLYSTGTITGVTASNVNVLGNYYHNADSVVNVTNIKFSIKGNIDIINKVPKFSDLVLSGGAVQNIVTKRTVNNFGNVTISNPTGIRVKGALGVQSLTTTLDEAQFYKHPESSDIMLISNGASLIEGNFLFAGNVTLYDSSSSSFTIRNSTVEVTGILYQVHVMKILNSLVVVGDDYYIQLIDGTYSPGGRLYMNDENAHLIVNDNVIINGGFITETELSNGRITLGGDFTQYTEYFRPSTDFVLEFAGTEEQKIKANTTPIANIAINNTPNTLIIDGILKVNKFSSNSYVVNLKSPDGKVRINSDNDMPFMVEDILLRVEGDLILELGPLGMYYQIQSNGVLYVEGDLLCTRGHLYVDKGALITKGDLKFAHEDGTYASSVLYQRHSLSYVFVGNDFIYNGAYFTDNFQKGVLEIKGDVNILTSPKFKSNHTTLLTGDAPQNVYVDDGTQDHRFYHLVLNKDLSQYTFNKNNLYRTLNYGHGNEIPTLPVLPENYNVLANLGDSHAPSGNFGFTETDLSYSAPGMEVAIARTYNSKDDSIGLFGPKWHFAYESNVTERANGDVVVKLADGSIQFYEYIGGAYKAYDSKNTLVKTAGAFTLTTKDRSVYVYDSNNYLTSYTDKFGNTMTFTVDAQGKITAITDQVGRVTIVEYGTNGFISKVIDPMDREVNYTYESDLLVSVSDPAGETYFYEYDGHSYLNKIKNVDGVVLQSIVYDHANEGRVLTKTNALGNTSTYYYDGINRKTTAIDGSGRIVGVLYDNSLSVTSILDPEGETTSIVYDTDVLGRNLNNQVKESTDRNGNKTSFTYDEKGNPTSIIAPLSVSATIKYDSFGNAIEATNASSNKSYSIYDANGLYLLKTVTPINGTDEYLGVDDKSRFVIETYEYFMTGTDAKGLLKSVTTPEGSKTSFTYDAYGNLESTTDGEGNVSTTTNNILGWSTEILSPLGYKTMFDYDLNGRLIRTTGHGGEVSRIVYDNKGNKIQEIGPKQYNALADNVDDSYSDSSAGVRTTYLSNGLVDTVTDELGRTVSYTYDILGNKLTEKKPNGALSVYEYDVLNRVKRVYFKDSDASNSILTQEYTYTLLDGGKSEVSVKSYQDYGIGYTTTTTYDELGRVIKTVNPDGSTFQTVYNLDGSVQKEIDPKSTEMLYTYDKLGQVIESKMPFEVIGTTTYYTITKTIYDNDGQVLTTETSNNLPGEPESYSKSVYEYDQRGLVTKISLYNNGLIENVTQYYYDAEGRKVRMYTGLSQALIITGLDSVTGPDTSYSVTKYVYDYNGQMTKLTNAMGYVTTNEYNASGELIKSVDANGTEFHYEYDLIGNLLREYTVTLDGIGEIDYNYTYDVLGNRATMTDAVKTTTYTYDEKGLLVLESDTLGVEKAFTYDLSGNRKSFEAKINNTVVQSLNYNYDNMGRLKEVLDGQTIVATYVYDLNGNRTELTYNNGNHSTYTYNLANSLVELKNLNGQNVISGETYTYYLSGNIHEKTDQDARVTKFTYDDIGRIESETIISSGIETTKISYTYDDYNNRSTKMVDTLNEDVTTTYTYDVINRLITAYDTKNGQTTYTYDQNGNMLTSTSQTEALSYSYNSLNEMTSVTKNGVTSSYKYDGNRLRISKTVDGSETQFFNDRDSVIAEILGADVKTYIRGINLIAMKNESQEYQWYYQYNYHGDVTELTDVIGAVVKEYNYDAFGIEENIDANDINPFRYTAEYFDKETGSIYLRARYYNPQIGRFINQDSYLGSSNDPLSLNLYTYSNNNPVMYIDPSGHNHEDAKSRNRQKGSNDRNSEIIRINTPSEYFEFVNIDSNLGNQYLKIIKEYLKKDSSYRYKDIPKIPNQYENELKMLISPNVEVYGVTGDIGLFLKLSFSVALVIDQNGNISIMATPAMSSGLTAKASVQGFYSKSYDAVDNYDYKGGSMSFDADVACVLAIGKSIGLSYPDSNGNQTHWDTTRVGVGVGFSFGASGGYTFDIIDLKKGDIYAK